jgi:hydrogenase large subunit
MVLLHDDLFDFFYQALPGYEQVGYEQVGYRRTLIGCWGSFQDPDVYDYDYRTMDKWGRALFVTPGVVVDRKLVTTSLSIRHLLRYKPAAPKRGTSSQCQRKP